jgi:exonuclease SbcD
MRFIHAADLHLDSPMSGLRPRAGGRTDDLANPTRTAFRRLVDAAIREKVDFVLIAGDVFDHDWADYATGLYFLSGLADLGKAGTRVVMVKGNHDAASHMSRQLRWPDNVHEFPSREPTTHLLEDLGVAIHGQSFPERRVARNLAAAYPLAKVGFLNIGMLHTSADGRDGHDTYAPCSLADLMGKGYDYWALGHVHQRRVLAEDPWVIFPGNLHGRHVNEPGEKGFTLVTAENGRIREVTHCPANCLRWVDLRIDMARASSFEDALPFVAEAIAAATGGAREQTLAARIRLVGATPAHGALIAARERFEAECDSLAEQALGTVLIEKILIETRPAGDPRQVGSAGAELAPLLRAIAEDTYEAADLRLGLEDALRRLPHGLATHKDVGLTHIGDERYAKLLADAGALLAHRLEVGDRHR